MSALRPAGGERHRNSTRSRKRLEAWAIAFALLVVLLDGWSTRRAIRHRIATQMPQPYGDLLTAHYGESRAIPPDSHELISALRRLGTRDFRFSGPSVDDLTYQRVTEGAWPIRNSSNSRMVIIRKSDPSPPSRCTIVWENGGDRIARCGD